MIHSFKFQFTMYGFMLALVIASGGFVILWRLINETESRGQYFSHPFFIPLFMTIGDALGIFIYMYEIRRARKRFGSYQLHPKVVRARTTGRSTYINPLKLILPKFLNIGASFAFALSLSYSGRTERNYQLMRSSFAIESSSESEIVHPYNNNADGSFLSFELSLALQGNIIFIIALISRLILKKQQYRHHLLGILLILMGIWMVAIPLYVDQSGKATDILLGTSMILGSIILFSIQYNLEEKLLLRYFLSPARIVGWEGIWGVLFAVLILPGAYFISGDVRFGTNNRLADSIFAFQQMGSSALIIGSFIGMIILSTASNIVGVTVMKYTSGNNRASLLILKIIPFWIFFLIYHSSGGVDIDYVQLAGYILLLFGALFYNEIIIMPGFGLNDNTMRKLELKDQQADNIHSEEESMSMRSSSNYQINI